MNNGFTTVNIVYL